MNAHHIKFNTATVRKVITVPFSFYHSANVGELTGQCLKVSNSWRNEIEYQFDWSMVNGNWDLLDHATQREYAEIILAEAKKTLDKL